MSFWMGIAVGVFFVFMELDLTAAFLKGRATGDWKLLTRTLMFHSAILAVLIFVLEGNLR